MDYGRKPCDIQNSKAAYMLHLKKLEELKSGRSHVHKHFRKQKKDIQNLLQASHKIHSLGTQRQRRKRQITSLQSQKKSYQSIHSILKTQIKRKILTVPLRRKPDSFYIKYDNMKLISKILNAKSQFNFKKQSIQNLGMDTTKNRTKKQSLDFSTLYQNSVLHSGVPKKIKLCLDNKISQWKKIHLIFTNKQNLCHENNSYIVMLSSSDKITKSKEYLLDDILTSEFIFKVPNTGVTIYFLEKINDKQIKRFQIQFTNDQLNDQKKEWSMKNIENSKHRIIGAVQVKIIAKKIKN